MFRAMLFALAIGLAITYPLDAKSGDRGRPSVVATQFSWLHLETKQVPDDFLPASYRERWIKYFLPQNIAENPSEVERIKASDEFRFTEARSEISELDPSGMPIGGYWKFYSPERARWPTRAIHVSFPSQEAYVVNVIAYCSASDKGCTEWSASLAHMPAPEPDFDYRTGSTESSRQWEDLALHEPCSPGPVHMEQPKYPSSAASSGITGEVTVIVLTNPCGDVRRVWIERSSRNRDLDRAAYETAQAWRIDVPATERSKGTGLKGRINIPFKLN